MTARRALLTGVAIAAVALISLAVVALRSRSGGAEPPGYVPDGQVAAEQGLTVDVGSLDITQQFEEPEGRVRWTVVTYASSAGPCLDIHGQLLDGHDEGKVGGCGPPDGPFAVGVGGLELGGTWYNIVHGTAPSGGVRMRILLGDGTSLEARVVRNTWVVVTSDPGFDVARVEALSRRGASVASIQPPSLAEAEEQLALQQQLQESEAPR